MARPMAALPGLSLFGQNARDLDFMVMPFGSSNDRAGHIARIAAYNLIAIPSIPRAFFGATCIWIPMGSDLESQRHWA